MSEPVRVTVKLSYQCGCGVGLVSGPVTPAQILELAQSHAEGTLHTVELRGEVRLERKVSDTE